MKRILLLCLTAAFFVPAGAHAAVPCRDKIYNEWYATGKVSTNYPLSCYHDALKNIPSDARVYSNLGGDIKAAMQVAITRSNDPGSGGPSAVGSGRVGTSGPSGVLGNSTTTTASSHDRSVAPLASSSSGGGVPTPILVLGAVAILLALAGLIGTGVQHAKRRRAV